MKVAFAGPSLFGTDVANLSGVDRRGPAARGDIMRAIKDGATEILLIDGMFGHCPSPGHKEILFGLSRGVRIAGCASMGALRATECQEIGMTGFGKIFEDYRDGRRVSDADVAVVHAPGALHWRPLSLALVDIDATLLRMRHLFDAAAAESISRAARSIHYTERSLASILAVAGLDSQAENLFKDVLFSQKAADAKLGLAHLRTGLPRHHPVEFEETFSFQADRKIYL
ncbi:MAG TPA: TfuA-like core domain-containing protein [Rhodobacteraceae bacterium]|nr:TfuA-like core domain-containing protein [Paracoccaceae bacterium]